MSPASSNNHRNRSCRTKQIESPHKDQFSVRPQASYGHYLNHPDPPMGNSVDCEQGRTCDEASRKNQDMEKRQSFPMGSIDSAVGESIQNRQSQPLAPVQEILTRGFHASLNQESSFRLEIL